MQYLLKIILSIVLIVNTYGCLKPATREHAVIAATNGDPIFVTTQFLTTQDNYGVPKKLTITNISKVTAKNIHVDASRLTTDLKIDGSNCQNLAPAQSCQIIFTPGFITTQYTDILISGSNTNTVVAKVIVLNIGDYFQGGFIFAVNPTATLIKIATGRPFSVELPVVNAVGILAALSVDDGILNTSLTVAQKGPGTYPEYLCQTYSASETGRVNCRSDPRVGEACYTDWYLPAICEMGPSDPTRDPNPNCPVGMQNMPVLWQRGFPVFGAESYWSSTSATVSCLDPESDPCAWTQSYNILETPSTVQTLEAPANLHLVYCTRLISTAGL